MFYIFKYTALENLSEALHSVMAYKYIKASNVTANQAWHLPMWGEKLRSLAYSFFLKRENSRDICSCWETSQRGLKFSK